MADAPFINLHSFDVILQELISIMSYNFINNNKSRGWYMFSLLRNRTWILRLPVNLKEMSSWAFVQQLNPIKGQMEWKVVHNDYDYNQEIATSCYGDMLHDYERNKKFGDALKKAIQKLHSVGKEAHVLDIGTGTGLLSMLAVKYGADSVTACEAFLPMANCAVNIIKENNFSDKIKVVKSHSTLLTVGETGDLKQKANVLVSEVFDTELIGEGAIRTFNHAFEHLLVEDCIVIPSSGKVYAQVIESDLAQKWNKLEDWKFKDELLVKIPKEIKNCSGAGAVHDIQLSEFSQNHFRALSEVIPIFSFDWARNKKIPTNRQFKFTTKAVTSGKAQVIFMWWDLKMDEDGEIIISCAPVWEHPDAKGKKMENDVKTLTKILPWRDHWMQAVYFLTDEKILQQNESFTLISNHDEFSFWFQIEDKSKSLESLRPVCNCAFHFLQSRTRIGAINDDLRRDQYYKSLRNIVKKDTVCIVLSDISLLGLLSAKLGARKVYVLSESPSVEKVYRMLTVENKLSDIISIQSNISQIFQSIDRELGRQPFDLLIMSEPYFRNFILPWDKMAFWYMKEEMVKSVQNWDCVRSVKIFPSKCRLRGCAVQFDNLWKIATPLYNCEGFSMKIFDELIGSAKEKAENYMQAQPLWEYPGIALTSPITFFEFNFKEEIPKKKIRKNEKVNFECVGRCDGIALWMEYDLDKDCTLSFGPVETIIPNKYISWDKFERQGVHLFRRHADVNVGESVTLEVEFDPEGAEFNFRFQMDSVNVIAET